MPEFYTRDELFAALEPTARKVFSLVQTKNIRRRFEEQCNLYAAMEVRRVKKDKRQRPHLWKLKQPVYGKDGTFSGEFRNEYHVTRFSLLSRLEDAQRSLPGCYMLLGMVHDLLRPTNDFSQPMGQPLLPWSARDTNWWIVTDGLAKVPGVVSLRGLYPEHVERALIRVKADLESRQPKGANLRRRGESDADGKAARPKEATPDKRGVNDRHKTPKACQVSAMKAYKYALKQSEPKPPSSGAVMPETPESLQLKTDTDVYDWLKDEQETKGLPNGYKLPSFHTWARYLRVVRRQTRTKKNTPAAGRAGRSVVSARALDKRGDGKKS